MFIPIRTLQLFVHFAFVASNIHFRSLSLANDRCCILYSWQVGMLIFWRNFYWIFLYCILHLFTFDRHITVTLIVTCLRHLQWSVTEIMGSVSVWTITSRCSNLTEDTKSITIANWFLKHFWNPSRHKRKHCLQFYDLKRYSSREMVSFRSPRCRYVCKQTLR